IVPYASYVQRAVCSVSYADLVLTEISALSLHDALPIYSPVAKTVRAVGHQSASVSGPQCTAVGEAGGVDAQRLAWHVGLDRPLVDERRRVVLPDIAVAAHRHFACQRQRGHSVGAQTHP